MRVRYLIDAYRALMDAANRAKLSSDQERALERAISDVMLFGQPDEVEQARAFIVAFAQDHQARLDPLLAELRAGLRRELSLEQTPTPNPYNLRFGR